MSQYTITSLPLSKDQMRRLSDGKTVRLKKESVAAIGAEGGAPVALTKSQLNRIAKAKAKGAGCQIELSQAQLVASCHHSVDGGGIWDSIRNVASGAAPVAKDLAASLLSNYGDQGLNFAESQANKALGNLLPSGAVGDVARKFGELGLHLGNTYAQHHLQDFVAGLSQSKNGRGLFAVGTGGSGLYAPGTH
jgi:hypothetical protein